MELALRRQAVWERDWVAMASGLQKFVNQVKSTALGVADTLTPVLKVSNGCLYEVLVVRESRSLHRTPSSVKVA